MTSSPPGRSRRRTTRFSISSSKLSNHNSNSSKSTSFGTPEKEGNNHSSRKRGSRSKKRLSTKTGGNASPGKPEQKRRKPDMEDDNKENAEEHDTPEEKVAPKRKTRSRSRTPPQSKDKTSTPSPQGRKQYRATPYWKAKEQDGTFAATTPPTTRSAAKKRRNRRSLLQEQEESHDNQGNDCGGRGMALTFSPPDQAANRERERQELLRKQQIRNDRVAKARKTGQLLIFSPRGQGGALNAHDFILDPDSLDQQEETTKTRSPPTRGVLRRSGRTTNKSQQKVVSIQLPPTHIDKQQHQQEDDNSECSEGSSNHHNSNYEADTSTMSHGCDADETHDQEQVMKPIFDEVAELRSQCNAYEAKLQSVTSQRDVIIKDLSGQLEECQRQLEQKLTSQEDESQGMATLEAEVQTLKNDGRKYQQQVEQQLDTISKLSKQITAFKEAKESMEQNHESMVQEHKVTTSKMTQYHQESVVKLTSQYDKSLADKNEEMEALRSELETCRGKLDEEKKARKDWDSKRGEMEKDMEKASVELRRARQSLEGKRLENEKKEKQISDLTIQLEQIRTEKDTFIRNLTTQIHDGNKERTHLLSQLSGVQHSITRMEDTLKEKSDSEMDRLERDLQEKEGQVKQMEKLWKEQEGLVGEWRGKWEKEAQEKESVVDDLKGQLEGARMELESCQVLLKEKDVQLQEVVQQHERAEAERLTQLQIYQRNAQEKSLECSRLQNELTSFQEQLQHAEAKNVQAQQASKDEMSAIVLQLQNDISSLKTELQQTKQELSEACAAKEAAKTLHNKTTILLREAQENNQKESSREVQAATALLEKERSVNEELRRTIQEKESELTERQSQLLEGEANLNHALQERDASRERLVTFDKREAELVRQLGVMEEVRRQLHNRVMQLSGNIRVMVRVRPLLTGEISVSPQEPSTSRRRKYSVRAVNGEIQRPSPPSGSDIPFHFPELCDPSHVAGLAKAGSGDLCKQVLEATEPYKDRGGLSQRNRKWKFAFDNVFSPAHKQEDIWKAAEPLVQSTVDGFNVCIFAYGQTSSGKTFTMVGDGTEENQGLIHRSVNRLFEAKRYIESTGSASVDISVELLEIYNEQIRCLLSPKKNGPEVQVQGNEAAGNVQVFANSEDDVSKIVTLAHSRRCVKSTKSNTESSRSHMLFTLNFIVKHQTSGDWIRSGRLHICDLAGSERLGKSGCNSGKLLKETQHINKSLSELSNVIEKLQAHNPHVPYRNSKLTQLLQNSLGGDSKTLAIVCCNPLGDHFNESLCSLKFAEKVSRVELRAMGNFSC